jgi:heme oxygenase
LNSVSPILQRLRRETHAQHEAVEANRFNQALAASTVTAADAAWFLSKLFGFVLPLEEGINQLAPQLDPAWELHTRRRAYLIPFDLEALLGRSALPLPLCPVRPPLATPAQALGALYVLEGSTLGGQVIARQLEKVGLGEARRYFTAYGALTGPRWQATCRLLAAGATPENEDELVASAQRTFGDLAVWLRD